MIKKWLVIYLCAFINFLNNVNAKYCERTQSVTSMVEVNFSTSYIASYHGQCYGCIKTKWATSVSRKYVPKIELKTVKYCCSGYMRTDDSSSDSEIVCKPICMPACKNGPCRAPGECACDTGYIPDPKDSHNCVPSCEKGCDHGSCVAPDTCKCDFGYKPVNSTCQPVCTDPCHNGTCVAPETCECLNGYRKSEKNLCEPYCSRGCGNGSCTAPETCSCNSGWHFKTGINESVCIQTCTLCDDESCVAPNNCKENKTDWHVPKAPSVPPYDMYYGEYDYDYYDLDLHPKFIKPTNEVTSKSPIKTSSDYDESTHSYTNTVTETIKHRNVTSTHSNDTIGTTNSISWLRQNWVSIFIPLLVVVTAAIIMLLVWRRAPIVVFFKGRSYVVEGDPVDNNGSRPFEDIQISTINEKDKTAQKQ